MFGLNLIIVVIVKFDLLLPFFNQDLLILHFNDGRVAEWLGRGLQNLVRRFESARDLRIKLLSCTLSAIREFFIVYFSGTFPASYETHEIPFQDCD